MEAYASVLLPIGLFTETPGTFHNAEGRRQRYEAATNPPGEARPAWRILRVLANRLGGVGRFRLRTRRGRFDRGRGRGGDARMGAIAPPDNLAGREPDAGADEAGEGAGSDAAPIWRVGEVPLYAVDPLVRRAGALQRTADAPPPVVRVNPALARSLGLAAGAMATVRQNGSERTLEVAVDAAVADGCVLLHAGVAHSVGLGPAWGPVSVEPAVS